MKKEEFLARLKEGLSGFPEDDIKERLSFYEEMIDDRMEEGLPEEEAVNAAGPVADVVSQILKETSISSLIKERVRTRRRLKAWEIVLLAVGSPIWLTLLIVLFALVLTLYAVLWALIAALWAVDLAFAVSALGAVAAGIIFIVRGDGMYGLALFFAGVLLAGLAIFLCYGCIGATKGAAILTKKIALKIKSLFLRKEDVK